MDWVDRPKHCKGLYGNLQLLQGSQLDNFPLKTIKLNWVALHSVTFQLKCLDFQSNQYKKLVPVLSRFCNGLYRYQREDSISCQTDNHKMEVDFTNFMVTKIKCLESGR